MIRGEQRDEWQVVDAEPLRSAYEQWVERIARSHGGVNHRVNETADFTPLAKPLAGCRVALVSTAGVHVDDQPPFHVETTAGDAGYRLIPDDVELSRLRFSHTHYDTAAAAEDPNVVLPLDALHDCITQGRVGAASPYHLGLMGFNPDPSEIADRTGPEVAARLLEWEVDVAILAPG